MLLITGIFMIVLGILAAASLIAAKQPNAQAAIDKLVPFQGIIGVIAVIWGAWRLVVALLNMGWLTSAPLLWIVWLASAVVMLALGFVLGYALISKYTMKTPEAAAKGEAMRLKLVGIQTPLGLISLAIGVWALIYSVMNGFI